MQHHTGCRGPCLCPNARTGEGRRVAGGAMAALPASLLLISTCKLVSLGHAWLVPDCGGAGAKIPVESTVRSGRALRRHRGPGRAIWGEQRVVWAPTAPSLVPRAPCSTARRSRRVDDAGLFLILNEIKGWNCF